MPDPDKLDDGVSPLLDAIDELHSRGVGQHVWLPQLVVCGFQPYATHSVLEDLLGVRFPMRVDPHALFVTKIVLRRNPISHLKVTIEPGPGEKAENDPQQPKAFLPNVEDSVAAQLSSCLEQATKFMEVAARGGHNHKIVRIEFYGPDKPNVTVINLPQIPFPDSSDNQGQQNESFHRIGVAYIQNPRNIIVVAISADDAMDLERTYKLAGKYGQRPKKLFGVVTGIDTVEAGSEKAKSWAKILKEGIPFSLLGLHYLCDASCTLLNVPGCEEDKEHKKDIRFFGQREENLFTKPQIGIEGLLHRLEVLLTSHVSNTMYDLASDIERKINTQRSNIAKLNTPRGTPQQQKAYMFHLSSAFERITEQALNGMYRSDFFVTSVINSEPNAHNTPRLRAIIHGLNEDFADIMISAGCRRFIFGVNHQITSMLDPANPYEKIRTPEHLGRMEFEREVTGLIQQYRGIEFPGNTNQILLGYLFRDQSKPWEDIARFHLLNSWETTRSFVRHLLNYLAGDGVSAAIMHEIVGPRLDDMKCNLLAKVEELTTYHKRGHPMPLHRSYFRGQTLALDHSHPVNTPKCQSNRLLTKLEETLRSCPATALTSRFTMEELKTAAQRLESSSNLLTVSDFVDQFQSYYNVSSILFVALIRLIWSTNRHRI